MRVGSDEQKAGEGVVLEDDLVDDAGSGVPESNSVLVAGRREEVVHLLVQVLNTKCVLSGKDDSITLQETKCFSQFVNSNISVTRQSEKMRGRIECDCDRANERPKWIFLL